MKKIFLAIITSSGILPLMAQVDNVESTFTLTDVCLIYGFYTDHSIISSQEFRKLADGSGIDLNLQYDNISVSDQNAGESFSALAAFSAVKNNGSNFFKSSVIRVGITGWGSAERAMYLENTEQMGSDTLISAVSGQQLVTDTSLMQTVSLYYSNSGIVLDASVLFCTNREKRWKLYAGAGITSGVTMDARTQAFSSVTEQITFMPVPGGDHYYSFRSEVLEIREDIYRNKNAFIWSLYIPAGIEFTLGRKRPFWRRLNLMYEVRPGIRNSSVAELDQHLHSFFSHGIGIKLQINDSGSGSN